MKLGKNIKKIENKWFRYASEEDTIIVETPKIHGYYEVKHTYFAYSGGPERVVRTLTYHIIHTEKGWRMLYPHSEPIFDSLDDLISDHYSKLKGAQEYSEQLDKDSEVN